MIWLLSFCLDYETLRSSSHSRYLIDNQVSRTTTDDTSKKCYKKNRRDFKVTYQAFWGVLIDLIMELLGLIIKSFDNQTEIWAWLSSPLIIKLLRYLIDNQVIWLFCLQNVYSQIQQTRLNPLSNPISQLTPPPNPFSYQPPTTLVVVFWFLLSLKKG